MGLEVDRPTPTSAHPVQRTQTESPVLGITADPENAKGAGHVVQETIRDYEAHHDLSQVQGNHN